MSDAPANESSVPAASSIPDTVPADMVVEPDPHAERRQRIQEEDGIHKTWMEEARAVKTVEAFVAFHDKLMNTYNHDYGTICHAVAALSVAGACLANADKVNGGITGFQASAIMWEWLAGWGTGPKNHGRMLDFDMMLYPQYKKKFVTISVKVWEWLQKMAEKNLAELPDAHPNVRAHWRSIMEGIVPFGYAVEGEPQPQN